MSSALCCLGPILRKLGIGGASYAKLDSDGVATAGVDDDWSDWEDDGAALNLQSIDLGLGDPKPPSPRSLASASTAATAATGFVAAASPSPTSAVSLTVPASGNLRSSTPPVLPSVVPTAVPPAGSTGSAASPPEEEDLFQAFGLKKTEFSQAKRMVVEPKVERSTRLQADPVLADSPVEWDIDLDGDLDLDLSD